METSHTHNNEILQFCPECHMKVDLLPKREEKNNVATTTFTNSTTFVMGTNSDPTDVMFKCSNPKCWVTKIRVDWF